MKMQDLQLCAHLCDDQIRQLLTEGQTTFRTEFPPEEAQRGSVIFIYPLHTRREHVNALIHNIQRGSPVRGTQVFLTLPE